MSRMIENWAKFCYEKGTPPYPLERDGDNGMWFIRDESRPYEPPTYAIWIDGRFRTAYDVGEAYAIWRGRNNEQG